MLNKEQRDLPYGLRVYGFLHDPAESTASRQSGMTHALDFATGKRKTFSEIAFAPFGFVLTQGSEQVYPDLCDLTHLARQPFHLKEAAGHEVIYLQQTMATGSPDQLVCAAAEANNAILVALEADMKQLASRHGVGRRRYQRLSLIKLSCRETRAAETMKAALSLIEHEWAFSEGSSDRRLLVEILDA